MNATRSMADYKRMAGLGSSYLEWSNPNSLLEGTKTRAESLQGVRIRRMANMLEDERLGGALSEVHFDPDTIERMMEAAQSSPRAYAASQHHAAAIAAHKQAHQIAHGNNPQASHEAHTKAAAAHRLAAKHMAAAGAPKTAAGHDALAHHHDLHAAMHARAMTPTQHAPAASGKKPGLIGKLKAKLKGIGGGNINWAEKAAQTGAPPVKAHPEKDPFAKKPLKKKASAGMHIAKDPFPGKPHEKYSAMAQRAAAGAAEISKSKDVSSPRKAAMHKTASHEHLHAALAAFHGGDHKKAMTHFNAAIHHMNKHHSHMDDAGAQGRQKARTKMGGGPRAAAGRAHV